MTKHIKTTIYSKNLALTDRFPRFLIIQGRNAVAPN